MMFLALAAPFAALLAEAAENEEFDADKVSPGVGGFVVIALLAFALFFLGLDLVRRLRRAKYRAEIQESLAAELAERDANLAASDATAVEGEPGEGEQQAGAGDPRPGASD